MDPCLRKILNVADGSSGADPFKKFAKMRSISRFDLPVQRLLKCCAVQHGSETMTCYRRLTINLTLRKSSRFLLPTTFCLVLLICDASLLSGPIGPATAQEETSWRRTRFGWVDTKTWERPSNPPSRYRVEQIHPLAFSALIVLLSVALLIWATEEYDWDRLTASDRSKDNPNPVDPGHPTDRPRGLH